MRIALGGLAAALALVSAAPAQAAPRPACAEGFETVCSVLALTCVLEPGEPCHP